MASPSPVQQGSPTPGDKTELIVAEPVVPFSTRCLKTLGSPAVWRGLLLGQVISFLLSFSGICSEYLTENNVNMPTTQSCINYGCLSLFLLVKWRRDGCIKLQVPWWKYFFLAWADVEGNFLLTKAFAYTSIVSVMLLDCFTIPCVMVIACAFMKAKYTVRHWIGVALCIGGLVIQVMSNLSEASVADKNRMISGDIMTLCAALCFAVSNTGEEACIKKKDTIEFLGVFGLCGFIINLTQSAILEHNEWRTAVWSPVAIRSFIGFGASQFAMYCLIAVFLNTCDATVFNLALLSSDAWGAFLGYKLFHQPLTWEYFTALSVVVVGVVLYNTAGNASFQRLGPVAALQPFSGYALPDETPVVDKPASGDCEVVKSDAGLVEKYDIIAPTAADGGVDTIEELAPPPTEAV